MRKSLFITFLVFVYIWSFSIFNAVKANDNLPSKEYIETVVGHVIRNMDKIDHDAVMKAELARLAHLYAIDMLEVVQQHLPNILEGVIVDMKLKADSEYKCSLTPNYKTKECE